MTLTDRRPGEKILIVVSCVIIFLGLGFLPWGGGNECAGGTGSPGHSVRNMYFVPAGLWTGFSTATTGPGAIPVNYSTDIQPSFEMSLLYESGAREPDRNLTLPSLRRFLNIRHSSKP